MAVATIDIQLEDDVIRKYTATSLENQKKLQMLLGFWLREFIFSSTPLTTFMDEMSDKAQERGLTPDILETLLRND